MMPLLIMDENALTFIYSGETDALKMPAKWRMCVLLLVVL